MQYRHENKYFISPADCVAIRAALSCIAKPDPHAVGGRYTIRSLYFDTANDNALLESRNGCSRREKYRIRCYNGSLELILLECKHKLNGLGYKEQEKLSKEQLTALLMGDPAPLQADSRPLVRELCRKMQTEGLRPVCVVEYEREPYIFEQGNVRVTIDSHIRTALRIEDFANSSCPTVPAAGDPLLLELKWDNYLPSCIADAVSQAASGRTAYSKYVSCRWLN